MDISLPAAEMDAVLGEIPDPDRALAELHRVLAPQGVLSLGEAFLDPDYFFPAEAVRREEAAGFRLIERRGSFWEYTLNFRRVTVSAPAGLEIMACPALRHASAAQGRERPPLLGVQRRLPGAAGHSPLR